MVKQYLTMFKGGHDKKYVILLTVF